jgi:hypothetical protein
VENAVGGAGRRCLDGLPGLPASVGAGVFQLKTPTSGDTIPVDGGKSTIFLNWSKESKVLKLRHSFHVRQALPGGGLYTEIGGVGARLPDFV